MLPGSSVNHHTQGANTEVVKISDTEVHGVATKDIEAGDELLCDYVHFGEPPSWLSSFAQDQHITLPFKGHNHFL